MSAKLWHVCVLLYGDYPRLARRCLSKLVPVVQSGADIRIGANEISEDTRRTCMEYGFPLTVDNRENMLKYPVMRSLLEISPLDRPYLMWFDDDSYIRDEDPVRWLDRVTDKMEDADMLGSIYTISLGGKQDQWIRSRDWYTGKEVRKGGRVRFATGGWWAIRTEILKRFDWPDKDLLHRGGDVMLGELCRQQGLRLVHYNDGVAINADGSGKESAARRRGYDSLPVGW